MKNLRGMTAQAVAAHNARMRGKPLDPAVTPRELSLLPPRSYAFVVPMPPTVNEAWHLFAYRDKKDGKLKVGKALTEEHRGFRSQVAFIVRRELQFDGPMIGRLELAAVFVYKNRRRTDISNRVKPLEDALVVAKLMMDDSQIDRALQERELTEATNEFCHVRVREIA